MTGFPPGIVGLSEKYLPADDEHESVLRWGVPDWSYWGAVPRVRLWQAVLLTFDVIGQRGFEGMTWEPDEVRSSPNFIFLTEGTFYQSFGAEAKRGLYRFPPEWKRRIGLAAARWGDSRTVPETPEEWVFVTSSSVDLKAFGTWARLHWELPDRFPGRHRTAVEGAATGVVPPIAVGEWVEGWRAIERELARMGVERSPRQIREYARRAGVTVREGRGRVCAVSIRRGDLPDIVRQANLVEARKRAR